MSDSFRESMDEWHKIRRRTILEQYRAQEAAIVDAFRGLSLVETLEKVRGMGIRAEIDEGFVVIHHFMLPSDYERTYEGTLLRIVGRTE